MEQPPCHYRKHLLVMLLAAAAHAPAFAENRATPEITITGSPLLHTQTINALEVDAEVLHSLHPTTSDSATLFAKYSRA